jgi:hypothetical protein
MRSFSLGTLWGLRTSITTVGLISYLGLWVVAAVLGRWLVRLPLGTAVLAGLLSALMFFLSEWLHQFGHALAAWGVGHPMVGIHFFNLFSASQYPADEPPLPPRTHVTRALGGFWINTIIGLLLLPVALHLWPRGGEILPTPVSLVAWLAGFGMFTNLLALGLGALIPLKIPGGGLNDGATLLHYWLERQHKPQGT